MMFLSALIIFNTTEEFSKYSAQFFFNKGELVLLLAYKL